MLYKKEEPGNEVDALFRLQSSTKYLRTPPPSPHLMLLHCLIIIQILINYALDFESANGQLRFWCHITFVLETTLKWGEGEVGSGSL